MSEPKWSPGPWRVGTSGPNGCPTVGTQQGLMVAMVAHGENHPTLPNAHLIATAPKLYEVLDEIQWGNAEFDPGSGENGCMYELCPMCDQSKVRGHAPDCLVGIVLSNARGEA